MLGFYQEQAGQRRATVAYATSQAWDTARTPPGVVVFDANEAERLGGQKPFVLSLNRLAGCH